METINNKVIKQAGRLKHFVTIWKTITTDQFIIGCIKGTKIKFETPPYQEKLPSKRSWSPKELLGIKSEIKRLTEIGAISQTKPVEGQFLSSYFLVPKPDGTVRFILNLRELNQFIKTDHFKMEDLRSIHKLLQKGMYMGTIDIKDAYFGVPIDLHYRKYLRFLFQEKIYEFKCLPFGLSISPYIFTKIIKPVVAYLRTRAYMSIVYLDDFLCLGESAGECQSNMEATVTLLKQLGFIINEKKSQQNPTRQCKFLGFIINSSRMVLDLPENKRQALHNAVKNFKNKSSCKIVEFAQMIGLLIASCPAVDYGYFHCKALERAKIKALHESKMDYEASMSIPPYIKVDLVWWEQNLPIASGKIKSLTYELEIFSDASLTGWGAFCEGAGSQGKWSSSEKLLHINHLELKAALLALKAFATNLSNCNILLRVDNTTALSYINKMGGVRFEGLHDLAREFWNWCEERRLWVKAVYIASKDNIEADALSRIHNIDTEWRLAEYAYSEILERFGQLEIDLFASSLNKKCKRYCSWERDPYAFAIDAFTLNWAEWKFYAFPPFGIIAKVLQKIREDRAEGIVVVPLWTSQNWFPVFQRMARDSSNWLYFQPNNNLLISPYRSRKHPLAAKLTLVVASLSGKPL